VDCVEKFSKAILLAARKREESWVNVGASGYYSLDMAQAAEMACSEVGLDTRMGQFVYFLLAYTWNDSLDIAQGILDTTYRGVKSETEAD